MKTESLFQQTLPFPTARAFSESQNRKRRTRQDNSCNMMHVTRANPQDIIILSLAHVSPSHLSSYQWGGADSCCSLKTTFSNSQIKQAEKTHLRSAALGSNSASNQPGLQTGKLSTPEIKGLEEFKMLGKQVMIADELLVFPDDFVFRSVLIISHPQCCHIKK